MEKKLIQLAKLIETQSIETLIIKNLACQCNIDNCSAKIKYGKKYIKIDIGNSGRYMIDKEGKIFGIKAYGVIHKGNQYGNLDTINDYYWGEYTAILKNPKYKGV